MSIIYRNNLKNREFGKENPQNFCSQQATIAEWLPMREKHPLDVFLEKQVNLPARGASENKNYEINPMPPKTDSISVCILTKNAQESLPQTLDSVQVFSEVLILDNGSTDATLEIARKYANVKIHVTKFCGFGRLRNQIAELAKNDWIFALDSDEVLTDSLIQEILTTSLNPSFAYSIPRHNFYRGKRIRGCGWGNDFVARLYHRKKARFSDAEVHESLETKHLLRLKSPILHTPYRTTSDFLAKMQHYSTLFAKQYQGKKQSSFGKALFSALFAFFRSYILKRGILDGQNGFLISFYNGSTAFYKYLKLKEMNSLLGVSVSQSTRSEQAQYQNSLTSK